LVAEELSSPWDLEEQARPEKFYLDVEEQVSTEIFLVGNQASPEKFYLGC
jgi:hypothetical protein